MKLNLNGEKKYEFYLFSKIIRTMRNILFLLLVTVLQVFANESYSQNTKINLSANSETVENILNEIETQSEFYFLCNKKLIDVNRKTSINVENQSITTILSELFHSTDIEYVVLDRQIVLAPKEYLKDLKASMQPRTVAGTVTDVDGEPLVGVTIAVKGTATGAITDLDGNYSISIDDPVNSVLIFSYVGFLSQEVLIEDQISVSVEMEIDLVGIEEVVVIGYGSRKKANLTGSVSDLQSDLIEARPATNVSTVLAGQLAGVAVIQKSGKPGDNSGTVRIRGIGTLGNSNPLVLVDGIESNLQNVDVNDIQSVSVLKDAASAAIYGVRAANGVILVTTKRGKTGAPEISYHGGYGKLEPFKLPERVDAYQFALLYNTANENDGVAPKYSSEDLEKWRTGSNPISHANNDQFQELLNTGIPVRQFHNISLSGGNDETKYFFSAGYNQENGLIASHGYERLNYRVNIDQKIGKRLTAGLNLSGSVAKKLENTQVAGQLITEAYRAHPGAHIYYDDVDLWAYGTTWGGTRNMIAYVQAPLGTNNHHYYDYINTVFAEYEIISGLKLKVQFGALNSNYKRRSNRNNLKLYNYFHVTDEYQVATNISGGKVRNSNIEWDLTSQFIASYSKIIGNHNFQGILGFEQRSITEESMEAARFGIYGLNEIDELNGVPDGSDFTKGNVIDYRIRSGFSRLFYDFKNKYLLEANLRYDGTSRFPKDKRFAFFPSFSAKWRISNEEFFNSGLINDLSVRASWGQLGNQEIGNYAFLDVYQKGNNYAFGGTVYNSTIEKSPLANSFIGWETTTSTNIGIDLALFNNKLLLTGEWFNRNTDDILLNLPQSGLLGANPPVTNAGSVNNTGFEFAIYHKNKVTSDLSYYFNPNISYVKNEITDLKGSDSPGRSVGDPVQNIFGWEAIGIFQNQQEIDNVPDQTYFGGDPVPGDIQYADINGRGDDGELTGEPDGVVDADDRKSLGTYFPKISFGLPIGLTWKGLDFSMVWQGFAGHQAVTSGPTVEPFWAGARPITDMVDNFWTESNTGADYPRLTLQYKARNYKTSSFWMRNAAFAKLRNIQLGYTFPVSLINRLHIKKLRVYISSENVLHVSGFKNFDPEFAHGNPAAWNDTNYPSSRLYLAGINVTF